MPTRDVNSLRTPLFIVSGVYSAMVFVLDVITPLGIEVWVMNLPVILVPVWLRSTRLVVAANVLCAVLVVAGSILSPAGGNPVWWDVLNRGMGIGTMCIIAMMAATVIQRSNALDAARGNLERESEAHRQTALALEKHVERLRLATEGAGMGTFDVDLVSGRVYCSAPQFRIAGQEEQAHLETSLDVWDSWVHPSDLDRVREARDHALRDRTPYAIEYRVVRTDARQAMWLAVFGRYFYNAAGKGIRHLGVAFDITRRKELEREVLGREVLAIISGKQRDVGQALHDSVGQELTGLGLMARSLGTRLPDDSAEKAVALRIISGIEATHRTIRELSRGLIPVHIETRGLIAALEDLATRMTTQSGVAVTTQVSERVKSPNHETSTQLFHIAQEAVTNAIRHGKPRTIRVSLLPEAEGLRLCIRDDGTGIASQSDPSNGLGLRIMHYRAGLIGAQLEVGSSESGGTAVTCTLPGSKTHDDR
jgi:signal transduction histidine kinase